MYNPTTPGSPSGHFRRAAADIMVGAMPCHADPTVMGHPAAEPHFSLRPTTRRADRTRIVSLFASEPISIMSMYANAA
jgi:hypothetical protein